MSNPEAKWEASRARVREQLALMTDAEDQALTDAALADPDNPPLTDAQLARMQPVTPAMAADLTRRQRGRPRLDSPKRLVSLRLDQEVVERFRATGPGWHSRVNQLLKEHLSKASG